MHRNPNDFQYLNSSKSILIPIYFPDLVKSNIVSKERLVQRFFQCNWDNTQDASQMEILYFNKSFVLLQLPDHISMVTTS